VVEMRKDIAQFTSLAPRDWQYPAFVAIHDYGSDVGITVRGKRVRNDAKGRDDPGPMAEVVMTWTEWRKVVADAAAYKRNV